MSCNSKCNSPYKMSDWHIINCFICVKKSVMAEKVRYLQQHNISPWCRFLDMNSCTQLTSIMSMQSPLRMAKHQCNHLFLTIASESKKSLMSVSSQSHININANHKSRFFNHRIISSITGASLTLFSKLECGLCLPWTVPCKWLREMFQRWEL